METSSNFVAEENSGDDSDDDFFIIFEWNDKNDLRLDFPHSKISLEIFSFFLKNIFRFTAAILQF